MGMSLDQTRETVMAYVEALLSHGPFMDYFTEDVSYRFMNENEETRGADEVAQAIRAGHSAAGELKMRHIFFGEGSAAVEVDWITKEGETRPYTVIYDCDDGKISALRLYFAGKPPI